MSNPVRQYRHKLIGTFLVTNKTKATQHHYTTTIGFYRTRALAEDAIAELAWSTDQRTIGTDRHGKEVVVRSRVRPMPIRAIQEDGSEIIETFQSAKIVPTNISFATVLRKEKANDN